MMLLTHQDDSRGPGRRYPESISGLIQRTSRNRAKSVSTEHSSNPCSMAIAARWASGRRLPAIRYLRTREPSTVACRSAAQTTDTMPSARRARPIHEAPRILRTKRLSRCPVVVLNRRNAVNEAQGSQIRRSPLSCAVNHVLARSCSGATSSTAQSSRFASISISAGPGRPAAPVHLADVRDVDGQPEPGGPLAKRWGIRSRHEPGRTRGRPHQTDRRRRRAFDHGGDIPIDVTVVRTCRQTIDCNVDGTSSPRRFRGTERAARSLLVCGTDAAARDA